MLFDQLMQCVTIWHPSDQSCVLTEWDHRIPSNGEILLACLGINRKQSVHKAEQLHDTLVLSDVLVTL